MYFIPGDATGLPASALSSTALSISRSGKISRSCSAVIPPGRRSFGGFVAKVTTVDSRPTSHSPAIKMASILPSISRTTCSAVVGLGSPEMFALGAAIGRLQALIKSRATSLEGILTATVSSPAETPFGIISVFGNTIVKGPGQNFSAQSLAFSGREVIRG